jgi:hypothetical protein
MLSPMSITVRSKSFIVHTCRVVCYRPSTEHVGNTVADTFLSLEGHLRFPNATDPSDQSLQDSPSFPPDILSVVSQHLVNEGSFKSCASLSTTSKAVNHGIVQELYKIQVFHLKASLEDLP